MTRGAIDVGRVLDSLKEAITEAAWITRYTSASVYSDGHGNYIAASSGSRPEPEPGEDWKVVARFTWWTVWDEAPGKPERVVRDFVEYVLQNWNYIKIDNGYDDDDLS